MNINQVDNAESFSPCIVIPVYNHEDGITQVLADLQEKQVPVVLVDDGSSEKCQSVLMTLSQKYPLVSLVRLPRNQGKGAAVKVGFREARRLGFSHALQVDADGQHDLGDVEHFISVGRGHPQALICGYPLYDGSVPIQRFYARYLTHVWVWINTLSLAVKDSMCGFRLYPLQGVIELLDVESTGNRMEFDSEIMVRWVWRRGQVINLPTRVSYPVDGISHFSLWRDNVLISKMHATLFIGMLWRSPVLLWRKLKVKR